MAVGHQPKFGSGPTARFWRWTSCQIVVVGRLPSIEIGQFPHIGGAPPATFLGWANCQIFGVFDFKLGQRGSRDLDYVITPPKSRDFKFGAAFRLVGPRDFDVITRSINRNFRFGAGFRLYAEFRCKIGHIMLSH